jgi:hypothetical protein
MQDEPRITELINADLDGFLSGPDRAELSRRLLQDPEARRLYEDLRRSDELLHRVAQAEPPPGLRESILGSLPRPPALDAAGPQEAGWARFRYAASLAAGVVIVGLGYGLMQGGADPAALQGSVAPLPPAAQDVAESAEAALSGGGLEGRARLSRTPDGLRLEINIDEAAPVDIRAVFEPAQLSLLGGTPQGTAGEILLPATDGPRTHEIGFAWTGQGVARIRLDVVADGGRLATAELSVAGGR